MMFSRVLSRLMRGAGGAFERGRAADQNLAQVLAEARDLAAQGQLTHAEERLRALCRSQAADSAEAQRMFGSVLGAAGKLDEARAALERALALEPEHPAALADLGNVQRLCGRLAEAESCYRRALAHTPANPSLRLNLALLEIEAGRHAAAVAALHELTVHPAHPEAVQALTELLDRLGRVEEAKAMCARVLHEEPQHAAAHAALGFLLLKRDLRPEQALPHLEAALMGGRANEDVLSNHGIALQDLGRLDDALASYDRALQVDPGYQPARFHRALALLMRGAFEQAWADYELRLNSQDLPKPPRTFRTWQGEALPHRQLFVYGEQGIGDEIMFASCLADLEARGMALVVACHAKLAPIFRRSFPHAIVMSQEEARGSNREDAFARVAAMVPIGSLPLHFRRSRASFPSHRGYLRADPELVDAYRARLAALGPGRKLGLSWRGGSIRSRQALRTLGKAELQRLFDAADVQFVDLQYDSTGTEDEIAQAIAAGKLVHWPDALADYDHTAALTASLDGVVSVCTAVIHLGGALGRPVLVMAPFSPEWRYGIAGETMPWYPSVRVLRQPRPGDWSSVISAVHAGLHTFGA